MPYLGKLRHRVYLPPTPPTDGLLTLNQSATAYKHTSLDKPSLNKALRSTFPVSVCLCLCLSVCLCLSPSLCLYLSVSFSVCVSLSLSLLLLARSLRNKRSIAFGLSVGSGVGVRGEVMYLPDHITQKERKKYIVGVGDKNLW